ncbi:MAG TPA: putative toxin-antitoxin system toxin component, PIN family [Oleiagrimonas sp.]|nr:putative toxin-antitoxin system toxin component, PIN family [Oleiagrimonas sp.]
MTLVAVIDTNVLAAGLMTPREEAPTAWIVESMVTARFPFALSIALLAEYSDVLHRKALRKRHGLADDEIEVLLASLARDAVVLEPAHGMVAPDPGDQHIWDLLAAHDDLCLVTGDKLLLRHRPQPAAMLTPAEFKQRMTAPGVHESRSTRD